MVLISIDILLFYHQSKKIYENCFFLVKNSSYDFIIINIHMEPPIALKSLFFFHYVSYYSSASWHEIIHTYWMVLRGNAVYRRIRKWRSVFILAVWGRIMYLPGLSFIVLRTCWKFCSNVSPISSISIPCFCCLAYKIKLPIFARKDRLIKTCLFFLTLRQFYILCANNVVLTLNILSVYAVFYFKHPECSHSLPTLNILSVDKMWSLNILSV